MKIIIYVDYSSAEFNKDFNYANLLIDKGHKVLLVTNNVQLNSAVSYYDLLIYGYSYSGQALDVSIANMNFSDFLTTNNIVLV